ncbi:MAG: [FeFe] hydrogenase H-cluster radical SAM maturase HydE, partial [Elusimicrobia bacterium]|nr:[FeFe] hydrogenase H-cluster radical SAM maturase HydE [Elusimicrobiota bacterium]
QKLAGLVSEIKAGHRLAITLSVGEMEKEDYRLLREAGADRFLLRFETSDRKLFSAMKPDADYDARISCLRRLRETGFQVGSGIMVGLPGQTLESIADDIMLFRELELDMVGIGPFIPDPDTPLAGKPGGTALLALKTVALTRIVTQNTHMPATTALGSIDPLGRQKALQCGANVLMPNVSPRAVRRHYKLYPGKICIDEQAGDCSACTAAMLEGLGRFRAEGPGHSLKSRKTD